MSSLSDALQAYPFVPIDRDNAAHYCGLLDRKLLINQCQDCGYWVYPHRPICPECLSWSLLPTEVSGKASLYMFTLIHQERDPNSPPRRPFVAAAVALVEQRGLRYLAPVVDADAAALRLDMPLHLVWVEQQGKTVPAFQVSDEEAAA